MKSGIWRVVIMESEVSEVRIWRVKSGGLKESEVRGIRRVKSGIRRVKSGIRRVKSGIQEVKSGIRRVQLIWIRE